MRCSAAMLMFEYRRTDKPFPQVTQTLQQRERPLKRMTLLTKMEQFLEDLFYGINSRNEKCYFGQQGGQTVSC